ncbi:heterokaryon incompatibility [Fusarium beomiforme]|uniref:Heterokaryon incompatibility n=1 Tax=Fusarium beomiforme TaxID=44412 RepID=A0A9P5A7Q6_9HYPO|nr:heterokaryon incompatibility [Fusarium beomiforme]
MVPVAPTWSWASIEGTVAVDLLPENSRTDIQVKSVLATIIDAASGLLGPRFGIVLQGPLLRIEKPEVDKVTGIWYARTEPGVARMARVFPDVEGSETKAGDELACLSFLVLARRKKGPTALSDEDVQGLVVKKVKGCAERNEDVGSSQGADGNGGCDPI